MFGKQKVAPKPKAPIKSPIPSLHVKRSSELWLETFSEAVFVYLDDSNRTQPEAIEKAHELANRVVDEFEKRWPGVKL